MKKMHSIKKIKKGRIGVPDIDFDIDTILDEKPTISMKNGVYFLNGDIDTYEIGEAVRFIMEANLNPSCKWKHITMIINSGGGFVSDGFALIDIMFGSRIPIRTVGIGMVASMGLQVFLAGEKGTRILTPNCMILSHQYAGEIYGKEHELVAAQKEQNIQSEIIMRHYKRTTDLNIEDIKKYLLPPHDVWITASEAKKYGICDIVKDLKPRMLK